MADTVSDVLMVVSHKSNRLHGDGATSFAVQKPGSLTTDFTAPVFELREFNFSVGAVASVNAAAEDSADKADKAARAADAQTPPAPNDPPGGKGGTPAKGGSAARTTPAPKAAPAATAPTKAPRTLTAKEGQADVIDMQPVEYTRLFDAASTQLFSALVKAETIDSISVVKRKPAGSLNAGEAYLRLDFTEVLMIGLDWKEGEGMIEETGTFIYRKLKVSYRPQKQDGSLDATTQISWSMKT